MTKKYLIGVDLGTSGTKAALYQMDGTLLAESNLEVPLYYPKPGIVEQENGDFYSPQPPEPFALVLKKAG